MSLATRYRRLASLIVAVAFGGTLLIAFAPSAFSQQVATRGDTSDLFAILGLRCAAGAEPFLRTELFFGTLKPDGSVVTAEQFQQFLDEQITPRFPDGLTLLTGLGQFRGSSGVIQRERSMLLILLYPRDTARESGRKIDEIRDRYERRFQQESVLRADDRLAQCVSF